MSPFELPAARSGRRPTRLQDADRLLWALEIAAAESRMLHRAQERVCLRLKVIDADPRVRSKDTGQERPYIRVVTRVVLGEHRTQPAIVALIRRLPGLAITQLGIVLSHF
jgi:hypothetical protein